MNRRLQDTAAVGFSAPHESAQLHVAGGAAYTDDLPQVEGTLHAALGLSPLAHGRLLGIDVERLRAQPGVVAVYRAGDIPGRNDCGPVLHDDPVLAEHTLSYVGQPVFLVVAEQREQARRAAMLARETIRAEELPAVLDARQAHALGQYVLDPVHLLRESSPGALARALETAPHRQRGSWSVGGQEQFYLEGQIAYAHPHADGTMTVSCSTQHPSEMQHVVAALLGCRLHAVRVECRRMGGGFGGKESQSALFACCAALAARQLGRPVKLRVDRDDDMLITGRRHGFDYDWDIGFDEQGRILGCEVTLVANAGHSADLSGPVMTRALCHLDNAYHLPEVSMHGYCARTNTQSNTAFRGFGGPQGALLIEYVLDGIARCLGLDALQVRRANFYDAARKQSTPYGQPVDEVLIGELVERLDRDAGYAARREQVRAFNSDSQVLKKGLALTPVKFGISFNVPHFNQAGALVHLYTDGSVLVNHGGTEMGQGLNTKIAQVVADALGIGLDRVRSTATDTSKVANTSATAASTGTDLNGMAALDAANRIRDRLAALAARCFGCEAEQVRFGGGVVQAGESRLDFDELVAMAYRERVQLWSDGFYATPGLHWDPRALRGNPFYYFAWGAAVSEVLLDTLTGDWRLLRADLLHEAGQSINPALDVGQVEGAFIQGMGWLTMEKLVWDLRSGALLTHAPSTYKIPTANDCPPDLRCALYERPNSQPTVHRSKAVGEPPLLLSFSVLLALRDAVAAVADGRVNPPLAAPATAEALLDAVEAVRAAS